jgi:hypothetical protein
MGRRRTFLALSESSLASMVMYLSPLILMPLEMTALGSLLSLNEAAMALISAGASWTCVSVGGRGTETGRATHREAWRRGPGSLAGGIADDGFVDVAGADEAAAS